MWRKVVNLFESYFNHNHHSLLQILNHAWRIDDHHTKLLTDFPDEMGYFRMWTNEKFSRFVSQKKDPLSVFPDESFTRNIWYSEIIENINWVKLNHISSNYLLRTTSSFGAESCSFERYVFPPNFAEGLIGLRAVHARPQIGGERFSRSKNGEAVDTLFLCIRIFSFSDRYLTDCHHFSLLAVPAFRIRKRNMETIGNPVSGGVVSSNKW